MTGETRIVVVRQLVSAPPIAVWNELLDLPSFAAKIPDVRSIRASNGDAQKRTVDWKVWLKGFELQWQEEQRIDAQNRRIEFTQTQGMFAMYAGHWQLDGKGGETRLELQINVDSGLPYLSKFVNPVIANAFETFAQELVAVCATRAAASVAA